MSFHEFTRYDRFRHVTGASGEKWTVNIERGNAFQGWRWFNSLDEAMGVEGGAITIVLAVVVDWPFRLREGDRVPPADAPGLAGHRPPRRPLGSRSTTGSDR